MISENIKKIKNTIHECCKNCNKDPEEIILIGASKSQSISTIKEALNSGLTHFGENYLQEAEEKMDEVGDGVIWHFIGSIQSRKAKRISELFDWVHTVDSLKVAKKLDTFRPIEKGPLNIFVQINIDNEETKSGLKVDELEKFLYEVIKLKNLELRGLMAIPRPREKEVDQRQVFRQIRDELINLQNKGFKLDMLSMGMSSDYGAAIKEGATMIRIGTDLFGKR
mgnify:FL=1